MCLFCVVLCLGRVIAMSWSLVQGVLPSVKWPWNHKNHRPGPRGCRASEKKYEYFAVCIRVFFTKIVYVTFPAVLTLLVNVTSLFAVSNLTTNVLNATDWQLLLSFIWQSKRMARTFLSVSMCPSLWAEVAHFQLTYTLRSCLCDLLLTSQVQGNCN
jgi:hypothetical protein